EAAPRERETEMLLRDVRQAGGLANRLWSRRMEHQRARRSSRLTLRHEHVCFRHQAGLGLVPDALTHHLADNLLFEDLDGGRLAAIDLEPPKYGAPGRQQLRAAALPGLARDDGA